MVTIILVKTQQALCLASPFFTVACKSIFSTRLLFPWLPLCCFLPLFGSLDALESLRLLFSLPSEPLAWELFLLHTLVWKALLSSLFLRSSVPSPFPRMPLEVCIYSYLVLVPNQNCECFASFENYGKIEWIPLTVHKETTAGPIQKQLSTLLAFVATPGSLKQNRAFDIYCCRCVDVVNMLCRTQLSKWVILTCCLFVAAGIVLLFLFAI